MTAESNSRASQVTHTHHEDLEDAAVHTPKTNAYRLLRAVMSVIFESTFGCFPNNIQLRDAYRDVLKTRCLFSEKRNANVPQPPHRRTAVVSARVERAPPRATAAGPSRPCRRLAASSVAARHRLGAWGAFGGGRDVAATGGVSEGQNQRG